MKRIFISVAAATIVAAAFSGCASTKKASSHGGRASGGKITSIEQLSIVPGAKVDAPRFLGGVYSKNLVADGTAGAFPVTNLIVFEPKARSAWHTHGGSSGSTFAHIATNLDPSKRGVTWLEAVSQEAYKTIEAEAGITK